MRQGLLLFAHGARDPNWALPFEAILARLSAAAAARPTPLPAQLAFLEFMQPDLIEAGTRLADAGCDRVDIVPLFLGAGGHVRKDLPALIETLVTRHPHIAWILRPAVGEMPDVIAAMAAQSLSWIDAQAPAAAAPDSDSSGKPR